MFVNQTFLLSCNMGGVEREKIETSGPRKERLSDTGLNAEK